MAAQEKPQILDRRRMQMLAAMGIQVWYPRPQSAEAVESLPELSEPKLAVPKLAEPKLAVPTPIVLATEDAPARSTPAVKVEFAWLKGSATMLLLGTDASREALQHAKDIVRYADWLQQQSSSTSPPGGYFSWPQLSNTTTGTPVRALKVFMDKHFADQTPWFLLSDDVAGAIEPWLRELSPDQHPVRIVVLQHLSASVGDVASKKQIWQTLKKTS